MTFEQIIERANAANPDAKFHIFIEYADGKRGYCKSFKTGGAAALFCSSLERNGNRPIAYDRNGDDL